MNKPRSIFEEVDAKTTAPTTGGIDQRPKGARTAIRRWLMVLFALVVLMIAVGGLTRLTDSGLAITEWKPITGAVPPLSAEAWQSEFDLYRAIPEYQLQNKGMSLAEFKVIYWWEWGHRQLGRVIGLVWAVGFFGFLALRQIPIGWTPRLLGIGALGGLQGAIGWWMVSSGLTGTMLDVASYRLAVHLGLAFLILGLIAWYVFLLGRTERDLMGARRISEPALVRLTGLVLGLTAVQILLGALVAGIDAGRTYGDWPLMAGGLLPPGIFELTPGWRNFFENAGLVQFNHRVVGYILGIAGIFLWLRSRKSPHSSTRFRVNLVLGMMFLQIALGVMTVLYGAPLSWAIAHQLGAVILVVLVLGVRFRAAFPVPDKLRKA
jgi:cytochrome c oxidase assembly protein subunit 15